ncbi:restriction endonuclease subunit S, partial [Lactobacillus delbrueckii subsp. bulgaricus]
MKFKTLGELCVINSGGTPKRTEQTYWEGGTIPWVKISDIKGKNVTNTEECITEKGLKNSSAKMFPKGTILYTIFATIGEVGILDMNACTNQAIAGIKIKKPDLILTDYLYYFLRSQRTKIRHMSRGVAQNNINLSVLRKIIIPIPSVIEQRKIVKVMEQTTNIINAKKVSILKLDMLVKARF